MSYAPAISGLDRVGTGGGGAGGEESGDVFGPESSTDNAVVRFDATTGKLLQDSPVTVSDAGDLGLPSLTLSGNISAAAWTTSGVRLKGVSATFTDTSSSGTVAAAYTNVLGGNIIAASSATTFTDYYTTFITTPTAGANVTFTRKWAAGFSGNVNVAGSLNATTFGDITQGSGAFTTLSASGTISANGGTINSSTGISLTAGGTNQSITLTPTGTGSIVFALSAQNPKFVGGDASGGMIYSVGGTSTMNFSRPGAYDNIALELHGSYMIAWSSGAPGAFGYDVRIGRAGVATLQMGVNGATGVNQKLKAMDASAGTGGNFTLAGGNGSTAGGNVIFQTAITTTPVDAGKFDASTTAGDTRFFLYDVDNATLERVTVGAADTGGAGYKVLRIPN